MTGLSMFSFYTQFVADLRFIFSFYTLIAADLSLFVYSLYSIVRWFAPHFFTLYTPFVTDLRLIFKKTFCTQFVTDLRLILLLFTLIKI